MRPRSLRRSLISGLAVPLAAATLFSSCSRNNDSAAVQDPAYSRSSQPSPDSAAASAETLASSAEAEVTPDATSASVEVAATEAAAEAAPAASDQRGNGYVERPASSGGLAKARRAPAPGDYERPAQAPVTTSDAWDAKPVPPPPATDPNIRARDAGVNPDVETRIDNKSTFAMDVDTGSYTLARSLVQQGTNPGYDVVRTEEFVNYFDQQYPSPKSGDTFAIHVDGTKTPFLAEDKRILRVGIQGRRVDAADRKPVRLTFVVDNSGSMEENGKLQLVKDAMHTLVGQLDRNDQIAIVGFSDDAWVVLGPTSAIERARVDAAIDSMSPTSSTNAEAGLKLGYSQAQKMFSDTAINRVVLLSDGVANLGPTGPEEMLREIGDYARRDIDLNTVGVGTASYNDEMMERLADAGDGFYAYVDSTQEATKLFQDRLTSTLETIARNAKVQVEFNEKAVSSYRLLGFENRAVADRDFTNNSVDAGEIGAGHSITALYEVTLTPDALRGGQGKLGSVNLRWEEPNGKVKSSDADMSSSNIADSFAAASDYLRLDIVVAAYAEVLRAGPWSRIIDLNTVATNAQRLIDSRGAFVGNADVKEFTAITQQAARQSGVRPA